MRHDGADEGEGVDAGEDVEQQEDVRGGESVGRYEDRGRTVDLDFRKRAFDGERVVSKREETDRFQEEVGQMGEVAQHEGKLVESDGVARQPQESHMTSRRADGLDVRDE